MCALQPDPAAEFNTQSGALGGPRARGRGAEPDDGTLLRSYLAGDSEAFAALVRRHEAWMWMFARAMLSDRDDAMDAVQVALLRTFRFAHTWRGDASVATWLYHIVSRVVLDTRAGRARIPIPVETEDNPVFDEMTAPDNAADAVAERVLQDVVASLPADFRECFVRTELLGFTPAEVAADLGIPVGTVKSRRARAKARLQMALRNADLIGPRSQRSGHVDRFR